MSAITKHQDSTDLRSLARDALTKSRGNTKRATDNLTLLLEEDKALLRAIVSDAIQIAAYYTVNHAMRHKRAAVVVSAEQSRSGVVALASGISASLLDFPLAGGLRLRNATASEVTDQIDRYDAIGRDVRRKARWLRLIVQSVPPNKKVGDVISDSRAQELWNEAAK